MSWLVSLVLNWLWGKILAFAQGLAALFKQRADTQKSAEQSIDALKKAETAKEIDDASDDALNGL